jgi:hypothetical protein
MTNYSTFVYEASGATTDERVLRTDNTQRWLNTNENQFDAGMSSDFWPSLK